MDEISATATSAIEEVREIAHNLRPYELDRLGLIAAIFHIMNHATFKASLFMAAGIIDHESGTRDIRRLSGLWRFMPITATLAMVAAAAMAGLLVGWSRPWE